MRTHDCAPILALALLAAGCGGSTGDATGSTGGDCTLTDKKMVYVSVLRENPVIRIMAQGAVDGAKKAGFGKTEWLAAQGFDEPASAQLGNQAIAQGVDGIVVFATSPAFYPMIAKARAAKIPVIQAHSDIPEGDAPGVLAVVAPDPRQYGAAAAEAIGMQTGGTGTVAITQSAFIPNENAAATAFTETIKAKYPQMKVLKPQVEGGDPQKAIAVDTSIVQANPDLVAVFGTNGNSAVTWATTQRDTGKKLTIIGMDYAKANLDLVAGGEVYAVVAQPLYEEHEQAAQLLAQAVCGEKLTYQHTLDSPIVTKDGVDKYYDLLARVRIS